MTHIMAGTAREQHRADIQSGNADVVRFIDESLPRIYGYILVRVAQDHSLAEDLTQETMIAFAQALQSGHLVIADPMAWLFGTARNKVIDHFRRQQRSVQTDPWPERDIATSDERDLDRVLHADELSRFLANLPPMQQAVLILHYNDGLRVGELARQFNRSDHAIESLLARGRAAIRQQIALEGCVK